MGAGTGGLKGAIAQNVMKKYGISGDRHSIKKTIFVLKNKISAMSIKLKRFETQEKSKIQNEMFMKNRKQFYRAETSKQVKKMGSQPHHLRVTCVSFGVKRYLGKPTCMTQMPRGSHNGGANMNILRYKSGVVSMNVTFQAKITLQLNW